VLTVRPKVAELNLQLFGRALHPELFDIHKSTTVERGEYRARIDITTAGHLVTWQYGGMTLTEVAAAANHPLPERRRLLRRRLRGSRNDRVECRGGIVYQVSFELEPVNPEIFWTFQEELSGEQHREGLLHQFESSGRMAVGALSYISADSRDRSLLVQSFHTFPDDYAIVKVQSLFELP
jgi:hypothetical protein